MMRDKYLKSRRQWPVHKVQAELDRYWHEPHQASEAASIRVTPDSYKRMIELIENPLPPHGRVVESAAKYLKDMGATR